MAAVRLNITHPWSIEYRDLIRSGVADHIMKFLAKSPIPLVDSGLSDGKTLLHYVCAPNIAVQQRLLLIEWACRNNATVDLVDSKFNTPLHMAAQISCLPSFLLLLDFGFSPTQPDTNGWSPLHVLVSAYQLSPTEEHLTQFESIFNHSSIVLEDVFCATDRNGETPLFCCYQPAVLELLFKFSYSIDRLEKHINIWGKNPYQVLLQKLEDGLVKDNCDISARLSLLKSFFQSPVIPELICVDSAEIFFDACSSGNITSLSQLFQYPKSCFPIFTQPESQFPFLEARNLLGYTGFHLAILNNKIAVVKFLLKHFRTVQYVLTPDGRTPLHLAIQSCSLCLAKLLIKFGSSLDATDVLGHTPLHYALYFTDHNFLHRILDILPQSHVVDLVNITDRQGWTALHHAAIVNNFPILELLFQYGADIERLPPTFEAQEFLLLCNFFANTPSLKVARLVYLLIQIESSFLLSPAQLNFNTAQLIDSELITIAKRLVLFHPDVAHINLTNNNLTQLPHTLLQLAYLQDIILFNNPFVDGRLKKLAQTPTAVDWKESVVPYLLEIKHEKSRLSRLAAISCNWLAFQPLISADFLLDSLWDAQGDLAFHQIMNPAVQLSSRLNFLTFATSAGFDINTPNLFTGMTPLHSAASICCLATIQELCQLGADPFALNHNGENFLHTFVRSFISQQSYHYFDLKLLHNCLRFVESRVGSIDLIINGQTFYTLWTPLHLCFQTHEKLSQPALLDLVTILTHYPGISLTICDASLISPLQLIQIHFSQSFSQLIISTEPKASPEECIDPSHLNLFESVIQGQFSRFLRLSSTISDLGLIALTDKNNWSILHTSARWNQPRITENLCEKFIRLAKVDYHTVQNYINQRVSSSECSPTALHIAAYLGHSTIVQILLNTKMCNLHLLASDFDINALTLSCLNLSKGHVEAAHLLIDSSLLLDVPISSFNLSPILFCCQCGNLDVILKITSQNVDYAIQRDISGRTPLDYIRELSRRPDIMIPNLSSISILLNAAIQIAQLLLELKLKPKHHRVSLNLNQFGLNTAAVNALLPSLANAPIKNLDLSDNRITSLPLNLRLLTQLQTLRLQGNSLDGWEGRLARESSHAHSFVEYLNNAIENPIISYKIYGIIHVVGSESSGKSTICRILADKAPETFQKTISEGIQLFLMEIKPQTTIQLWDFSGQVLYEASHQLFVKHSAGTALFFDVRSADLPSLRSWLNSLASSVLNPRIVLVGIHSDSLPDIYPLFQQLCGILRTYSSHIIGEVLVSTSASSGIHELRSVLQQLAETSPSRPMLRFIDAVVLEYIHIRSSNLSLKKKPPIISQTVLERMVMNDSAFNICSTTIFDHLSESLQRLAAAGCIITFRSRSVGDRQEALQSIILNAQWAADILTTLAALRKYLPFYQLIPASFFRLIWGRIADSQYFEQIIEFFIANNILIDCGPSNDPSDAHYLIPLFLPQTSPSLIGAFTFNSPSSIQILNCTTEIDSEGVPFSATYLFTRQCRFNFRPTGLLSSVFLHLSELGRVISVWANGIIIRRSRETKSNSKQDCLLLLQTVDENHFSGIQISILLPSRDAIFDQIPFQVTSFAASSLRRASSLLEQVLTEYPMISWEWYYQSKPCGVCDCAYQVTEAQLMQALMRGEMSFLPQPTHQLALIVEQAGAVGFLSQADLHLAEIQESLGKDSQDLQLPQTCGFFDPLSVHPKESSSFDPIISHTPFEFTQMISLTSNSPFAQDTNIYLASEQSHPPTSLPNIDAMLSRFRASGAVGLFSSSILETSLLFSAESPDVVSDVESLRSPAISNSAIGFLSSTESTSHASEAENLRMLAQSGGAVGFLTFEAPESPSVDLSTLLDKTEGLPKLSKRSRKLKRCLRRASSLVLSSKRAVSQGDFERPSPVQPHSPRDSFIIPSRETFASPLPSLDRISSDPIPFVKDPSLKALTPQLLPISKYCGHDGPLLMETFAPDKILADYAAFLVPQGSLRVDSVIGRGGFGQVFRSEFFDDKIMSSTQLAMKRLDVTSSFQDFVTELEINASLSYPGIIRFIGFCLQPQPALLFELASGGDLYSFFFDSTQLSQAVDDLWNAIGRQVLCRETVRQAGEKNCYDSQQWLFESVFAEELIPFDRPDFSLHPSLQSTIQEYLQCSAMFYDTPTAQRAQEHDLAAKKLVRLSSSLNPSPAFPLFLRIAIDLAATLQYLHSFVPPLVHLDLKLLNILVVLPRDQVTYLSPAPFIRLIDFGISRYTTTKIDTLSPLTTSMEFNPRWAAPELLKGQGFNPSSDIYSYSLIMAEILTTELCFSDFDGPFAADQIRTLVISGERPYLPAHLPLQIVELLNSCWDSEYSNRPSATQLMIKLYKIAARLHPELLQFFPESQFNSISEKEEQIN